MTTPSPSIQRKLNIYFACSITGGRDDQQVYKTIVDLLIDRGHHVPTAQLASTDVLALESVIDPVEVYRRDVTWIEDCDFLLAEVSTPSHGVGYEIGFALGLGRPVLCLYRGGAKVSKMILGNQDPNLTVKAYETLEDVERMIGEYIEE